MPTRSPGLKRLPRWRTMISPPLTVWPANVLTPRRWALESRPLRLEPSPFLCAICRSLLGVFCRFGFRRRFHFAGADLHDLDPGQLLAGTVAALVAALGLELEDTQLLAAHVLEHLRRDLHLFQAGPVEDRFLGAVEQRLQRHVGALLNGEALDEQGLAPLDAVLLSTGLHDRVH